MLTNFPIFKRLTAEEKPALEALLDSFPPYSDFNFASLFSWNISNDTEVSILNNNLVIRLRDYTSEKLNYSFLGPNHILETANTLLEFLEDLNIYSLKLVPQHTIDSDTRISDVFKVSEMFDQNDYILDVAQLAEMTGSKFHKKRNLYKKFEKENVAITKILKNSEQKFIEDSEKLFLEWAETKRKSVDEYKDEFIAFKNSNLLGNTYPLDAVCLYIDEKLAGFTSCEIINQDYCMIHFEKTDPKYAGISEYLIRESSKFLFSKGIKYINFQQDLGIPGLKYSKSSYHPIGFLKKYSIEKSAN